jgi:hypothetical protein
MKVKIDPLYAADGDGAVAETASAVAATADAKPAEADKPAAGTTLLDKSADGEAAKDAKAADAVKPEVKAEENPDAKAEDKKPEETPEAKAEREASEAAAAKLAEVPEDGKYEFALPEGVTINEKLAEIASPRLKELGVTRAQANGLAGIVADHERAQAEAFQADWAKTNKEWADTARADAEYGGDKFAASLDAAQRALDKFGTPELRQYLTASGGGNHPEMIRLMARVGNAFSDDRPVGSETPAKSQPRDLAEILYGPKA